LAPPQPEQLPPAQVPAIDEGTPQVWPGPTQLPPKQQAPAEQTSPVQQAPPGVPQLVQNAVAGSQARVGLLHRPFEPMGEPGGGGQHCSPACPPQRAQKFLMQAVPPAVQSWPGQQGWPVPPQVPQAPAMQRASSGAQVAPSATHRPAWQQPPPLQALLVQQASPGPPQAGAGGASGVVVPVGPSAAGAVAVSAGPLPGPPSGVVGSVGRPLLVQASKKTRAYNRGAMAAHYPPR
jgi:hypothetical protein